MRRSLAPSQIKKVPDRPSYKKDLEHNSNERNEKITIQRVPMFDFLSIPDSLRKTFQIPTGCKITNKTLELRKVKTLGLRKVFQELRPGNLNPITILPSLQLENDEDENQEDDQKISEIPPFERLVLWQDPNDESNFVEVIPHLASKLRPHQREGVTFLFECTMGLRGFDGQGCILADDMGLGKTLMSITLIWTLLNQGFVKGESAVRKVMVVCPTSLVGNWENEIRKWVGDKCNIFAVKGSEPKKIISNFVQTRVKGVLVISYETQRRYSSMFHSPSSSSSSSQHHTHSSSSRTTPAVCDMLVCDEAHKLKNAECGLSKTLNDLPARKRILLSGTPMQNELSEFFNMVNFCNPGVLGTSVEFRKNYERPILLAREPDATEKQVKDAARLQKELSVVVNEFILKRGNILNAQHLPPKLVQFVCCRLSPLQEILYLKLLNSKECQHIRDGKQSNTLNFIRLLISICSHPRLLVDSLRGRKQDGVDDQTLTSLVETIQEYEANSYRSSKPSQKQQANSSNRLSKGVSSLSRVSRSVATKPNGFGDLDPEQSGKFLVLYRLMQTLQCSGEKDRIVIVSNYTSTLNLIGQLCSDNNWPYLRLDGTTTATKRTKLVDDFNDPHSHSFAFLLSSKAGGCGINLIGGNRLVLFDPDWNPASDKQAAGRIWREGQKKRCFIYRFMSTGTIEEKIIQRQLSKEGLQNIVDDKEQVNIISTEELKSLFIRPRATRSDTHDTLRCKKCSYVQTTRVDDSDRHRLDDEQINSCERFLRDFCDYLTSLDPRLVTVISRDQDGPDEGTGEGTRNDTIDLEEIHRLREQLLERKFPTLPLFSRRLRDVVTDLDKDVMMNGKPIIFAEFQSRWSEMVPQLALLKIQRQQQSSTSSSKTITSRDGEDGGEAGGEAGADDEEHTEQEGCPNEDDFNNWSHHCSVSTCDDHALRTAMSDDSTVSFIFGLEVTWSLLQEKIEATKEEVQQKKEQFQKDLEALNLRRSLAKETKEKRHRGDENEDVDHIDAIVGVDEAVVDGGVEGSDPSLVVNGAGKRKRGRSKVSKVARDSLLTIGTEVLSEKRESRTRKTVKRLTVEEDSDDEGEGEREGEQLVVVKESPAINGKTIGTGREQEKLRKRIKRKITYIDEDDDEGNDFVDFKSQNLNHDVDESAIGRRKTRLSPTNNRIGIKGKRLIDDHPGEFNEEEVGNSDRGDCIIAAAAAAAACGDVRENLIKSSAENDIVPAVSPSACEDTASGSRSEPWSCHRCTFLNDGVERKCATCGARRRKHESSKASAGQERSGKKSVGSSESEGYAIESHKSHIESSGRQTNKHNRLSSRNNTMVDNDSNERNVPEKAMGVSSFLDDFDFVPSHILGTMKNVESVALQSGSKRRGRTSLAELSKQLITEKENMKMNNRNNNNADGIHDGYID